MTTETEREARRAYRTLPFWTRRAIWKYARSGERAREPELRPHVAWVARRWIRRFWWNVAAPGVGMILGYVIMAIIFQRPSYLWLLLVAVPVGSLVGVPLAFFFMKPRMLEAIERNEEAGPGATIELSATPARDQVLGR